jgi:hypothetical protein
VTTPGWVEGTTHAPGWVEGTVTTPGWVEGTVTTPGWVEGTTRDSTPVLFRPMTIKPGGE